MVLSLQFLPLPVTGRTALQFRATRIECHIVACYDSTGGGFLRPHRDNTTRGTAHRRFAVSLNLNTDDDEGGLLRFPEFGQPTYTAPAGGAVINRQPEILSIVCPSIRAMG